LVGFGVAKALPLKAKPNAYGAVMPRA